MRWLNSLCIAVRLLPAQYVRAYVKRNKTDTADAAALLEAARASDMRPVRVKSVEQQALQGMHRTQPPQPQQANKHRHNPHRSTKAAMVDVQDQPSLQVALMRRIFICGFIFVIHGRTTLLWGSCRVYVDLAESLYSTSVP